MTLDTLLVELADKGITLKLEEGRLRVAAKKGVMTAGIKEAITQRKPELISLLSLSKTSEESERLIPAVDREPLMPVSPGQRRLWFLERLAGPSATYNVPVALRIDGRFEHSKAVSALNKIAERHEVLRTRFLEQDSGPMQSISESISCELPVLDLTSLPDEIRRVELARQVSDEAKQPFDIDGALLWRVRLILVDSMHSVLLLTMHHSISDGWSLGVFLSELANLYTAYANDSEPKAMESPVQFADYSAWQASLLTGKSNPHRQYWRKTLAGAPPLLQLPTDRPRPVARSNDGAMYSFTLDDALRADLRAVCNRNEVTLFMLLMAAYRLVLFRSSGQRDVMIGTIVANRESRELGSAIGYFANTIAIRSQLHDAMTFQELLQTEKEAILQAFEHQSTPFEQVVEDLQPKRSLSHTPLIQTTLVLHNTPADSLNIPGLKISALPQDTGVAKFDLNLTAGETDEGLVIGIQYSSDLFDRESIEGFAESFQNVLIEAINQSDKRLDQLSLVSPDNQSELIENSRRENETFDAICLHELIARAWEHRADSVAVTDEYSQCSYGVLSKGANQIASFLTCQQIGPEDRVGVCMNRSVEQVTAILGVLRSGAAYVPLDPDYPAERLEHIMSDAQVSMVMASDETTREKLSGCNAKTMLFADALVAGSSLPVQTVHVNPENAAYVIYTSGSTGLPKGVVVTHLNASRLLLAANRCFSINSQDVWTLFHSFSFDFSVWEMFGALANGSRLFVVPYWLARDPERFRQTVTDHCVTLLSLTPSAFQMIFDSSVPYEPLNRLTSVVFGGEALRVDQLRHWVSENGYQRTKFINMYGITETTVHVTFHQVTEEEIAGNLNSIGKPLPDLQLYALDSSGEPVRAGWHGELFVGGAGVARGYLGKPGLTAERFLPDPYSEQPGARLYRSGDKGRLDRSGLFCHLGRLDSQVKVRGYRIELGEIQFAMNQLPDVDVAIAVLHEESDSSARIVGYVIPVDDRSLTADQITHQLQDRLPKYMIPAYVMVLDQLPLTANGKLDRNALPEPGDYEIVDSEPYVAPVTQVEEILVRIWQEVLERDGIGVTSNYFSLGGDSIRSVNVLAKLKERGFAFELQDIFKYQTIRDLSEHVTRIDSDGAVSQGCEAFDLITQDDRAKLPEGAVDAYPLSALQSGMIFHSEVSTGNSEYHNVNSLRIHGKFVEPVFRQTLQVLVDLHPVLRTSIHNFGYTEALQIVWQNVAAPLQVEAIDHLSEEQQRTVVEQRVREEVATDFVLERAPLFKLIIYTLSQEEFQLIWVDHHAILDGWSVSSFFTDLFTGYMSSLETQQWSVEAPKSTFREFLAVERQQIEDQSSRSFWSRDLENCSITQLPVNPSSQSTDADQAALLDIEQSVADTLHRVANSLRVPFKTVLLAIHFKALSIITGQRDIVSGIGSNGRLEQDGGTNVLGLFLNTLPFRMQIADESWSDFIDAVYAKEQQLFVHRRFPLQEIQGLIGKRELIQVSFVYNNFHVYRKLENANQFYVADHNYEQSAIFPLQATFREDPDGSNLQILMTSQASALSVQQFELIKTIYMAALNECAINPHRPHGATDYLPSDVRENELRISDSQYHCTDAPVRSAPELFARCVASQPKSTAVVTAGKEYSYAELDQLADSLAVTLQSRGVGPRMRVAILLQDTECIVVAALAIMKLGSAFVTIDPKSPPQRIARIVDSATPIAAISSSLLADALADIPIVLVDSLASITSAGKPTYPVSVHPEDLAYLIYTSGTTGVPKGVCISHRALCSYALNVVGFLELDQKAEMAALASPATDLSFTALFGALLTGRVLRVLPEVTRTDPAELEKELRRRPVDCLKIVPSHFDAMFSNGLYQVAPSDCLVFGGEALTPELAEAVSERYPSCRIVNHYGPTETTVGVSAGYYVNTAHRGSTVSIGRAFGQTQIYLLDANHNLAAPGALAEIYIGGTNLSEGYWQDSALTAERFVPDPFNPLPGQRLFRTYDFGRRNEDGSISFEGRIDNQVKVRGHRIELGELEHHLRAQEGVSNCCANVWVNPGTGASELIAYCVPVDGESFDKRTLLDRLKKLVPAHMIPTQIVQLDSIPLTPSGKINRLALSAPDIKEESALKIEPRNEVERILAAIWTDVLGIDSVSVTEDFFEIGGHSISSIRVIARVRDAFQTDVPLEAVFDAPTIERFALYLSQRDTSGVADYMPLTRREISGGNLFVSPAQQRLWLTEKLVGPSAEYNIPSAVRLQGPLDREVLETCFTDVVNRHDALRMSFQEIDGQLVGSTEPKLEFSLELMDLSLLDDELKLSEARKLALHVAKKVFDLGQAPLVRAALVELSENDFVLVTNFHHIIFDGWSANVVMRELVELYNSKTRATDPRISDHPIQFTDYIYWQRDMIDDAQREDQLTYWQESLRDSSMLLTLPRGTFPDKSQLAGSDSCHFTLDPELSEALRDFSQAHNSTLYITLIMALSVVVSRYCNSSDVIIGSPVTNRPRIELEEVVGFFVNTLPFRFAIDSARTLKDLMAQVRRTVLDGFLHQDVSFEEIINRVHPPRVKGRSPLVQVAFALVMDALESDTDLEGVTTSPFPLGVGGEKFDLTFSVSDREAELSGTVTFNCATIDRPTVRCMIDSYIRLLRIMVQDAAKNISELSVLSESEEHQLVREWNETETLYPRDTSMHEIFSETARLTPEAIALSFDGAQVTYGVLEHRANQIARYLMANDVQQYDRVGVVLERSIDTIVSFLAILKCGATYVPLDIDSPLDRLERIVQNASMATIITSEQFVQDLRGVGTHLLLIDRGYTLIESHTAGFSGPSVQSNELAYITYTSGSTGTPKGVGVSHRSVISLVRNTNYVGETHLDRVGHAANVAFDATTFEIWGPLLNRGCVVGLDRDTTLKPESLIEAIRRSQISTLFLTTALYNQVVSFDEHGFDSLKILMFGGEKVDPRTVKQHISARFPGSLLHVYGPTESTTFATFKTVGVEDIDRETVPIGVPLKNTRAHILNDDFQPVPVGVTGELVLAGDGLAQGYINNPAKTASSFVPNPFAKQPGERLYRTGDQCKYLANGDIVFSHRIDNQIKLRGFRIELGEIEASLRHLKELTNVIVMESPASKSGPSLIAFCEGQGDGKELKRKVSEQCAKSLPSYMFPHNIIVLESFPLTQNRKVDRSELIRLWKDQAFDQQAYREPTTSTEKIVADIWKKTLGVEKVGLDDSFFAFGGSSLVAVRILADLKVHFSIDMDLRSVFDYPTLEELSFHVLCCRALQANSDDDVAELLISLPEEQVTALLKLLEEQPADELSTIGA